MSPTASSHTSNSGRDNVFGKVFAFELKYQLKSRLFLFGTAIFLLLTFLAVFSPNVQLGGAGGANVNSPFAIV